MSAFSDPLTALNLALIASVAVGLLLTSGRRRLRAQPVLSRSTDDER